MKTYVLLIAKTFPATHPRAGEPTFFGQKIKAKIEGTFILNFQKIHTIRKNYQYWKKRIDQVNAGNAVLSVRQWAGKPYNSKQIELFELHKNEVSIQKLEQEGIFIKIDDKYGDFSEQVLSDNDGLTYKDFISWFPIKRKRKQIQEPIRFPGQMAIIHFTSFRY